jgi:hypothetical protein
VYFNYLKHAHPDMMERSREKIDPYLAILSIGVRDPAAFSRKPGPYLKVSMAISGVGSGNFVRNEIKVAPVYITK